MSPIQCDQTTRTFFNIWPFATMKICQKALTTCQRLKKFQILDKHFQNCQFIFKKCHSGKILPYLVTLNPNSGLYAWMNRQWRGGSVLSTNPPQRQFSSEPCQWVDLQTRKKQFSAKNNRVDTA